MTKTERIYHYLSENPDAIVSEIVQDLDLLKDTVDKALIRLINVGVVESSGLRRNGKQGKPPRQYRLGGSKLANARYWNAPRRAAQAKEHAKKYRDQKIKPAPKYGPFSTIIQQVIR